MLPFPSRILQRDRGTLQHSCVLDSQRNKYRKKIGGTERDTSICIVRELPVASGGLVEMKFGRCYVAHPSHKSEVLHTFVVRDDKTGARFHVASDQMQHLTHVSVCSTWFTVHWLRLILGCIQSTSFRRETHRPFLDKLPSRSVAHLLACSTGGVGGRFTLVSKFRRPSAQNC